MVVETAGRIVVVSEHVVAAEPYGLDAMEHSSGASQEAAAASSYFQENHDSSPCASVPYFAEDLPQKNPYPFLPWAVLDSAWAYRAFLLYGEFVVWLPGEVVVEVVAVAEAFGTAVVVAAAGDLVAEAVAAVAYLEDPLPEMPKARSPCYSPAPS